MTATAHAPIGILLDEPLLPGSPEWLQKISASKISALLGLSTYESPYSLWHKMKGLIPAEPENDLHRRGHYLEPAIVAWFADQHPDWVIEPTGTWQHKHRDWQTASPDRLIVKPGAEVALLEVKSSDTSDWGEPGTNQVPPGVLAQCLYQLDVTGFDVCHVAMIGAYLGFAEYVVHRDERDMALMRERALGFLDTLDRDERPNIDDHGATYEAVKQLHPLIEPRDVELDADLARTYCQAEAAAKAAKAAKQLVTSQVADLLGNAKRARFLNSTIAQRQAKGEGTPYLVTGRNLPDFPAESDSS